MNIPNRRAARDGGRSPNVAEDRAVSEVVGAAILIGIAVVLATVIASFVLGIDVGGPEKPNAQLVIERPQSTVVTGWDDNGTYRTDVVQVRTRHGGGDGFDRSHVEVQVKAQEGGSRGSGYLLHYNSTDATNATEPNWNRVTEGTIAAGDQADYELFATDELGKDEGVIASGASVNDLWQRGQCHVEEFGNNRGDQPGDGVINISDGPDADENCPFNANATISSGDVSEGGRLAGGDTVLIIWSPSATSSQILKEDEI